MKCPYCGQTTTSVKDSRPAEDNSVVRRRRECTDCDSRFTTLERVQLRELVVTKRNGRRVRFERNKLTQSLKIALRKRPFDSEKIEGLVSKLVRGLETEFEGEITTEQIGKLVMQTLAQTDPVGYVRYASVYKEFAVPEDFAQFLETGFEGDASANYPSAKPSVD